MHTTISMTSHIEHLEVDELTNLRWQRLQLVVVELKGKEASGDGVAARTMDTILSMTPHIEALEIGELTNLHWQRLQLVAMELKQIKEA